MAVCKQHSKIRYNRELKRDGLVTDKDGVE